jgi:PAS domain S-box-containing protein
MENHLVQHELSALRASAELRAVTDSIQDYAIVLLDPQGVVLTWNTGARQIEGYTAEEIVGQGFDRLYTAEDRAAGRPQALLTEALRTGRAEDEGWRARKDGSRFWADEVISAHRGAKGAVEGYVRVTRDLTRRRQNEGRWSEERALLTVAAVTDYAIFMLDPQGTITSWNLGAERAKGYRADEAIGRDFSMFYTPEDQAAGKPLHLLRRARDEGRAEDEGWRVRKDGSRFWADVVISRVNDGNGKLVGFTKVTRDLTDRRRAEEQLRQAEERLRLMIESVQDYAIFMLDREGRVATWNRGAQNIKGYTAQEIVGQHFSRFYPPEEISAGKPERELEVASSKGRFEEEGWRIRKDGSRFWANVVLSATRNRDGVLIGFTKITRDLSERKRAAEEMAERARQQSVAAELGLYALQTAQLAQVIERSMQTVRETLQIDDVCILRAGESAPPGARTVRIHAPEPGAEYGFLAASASRPLTPNDVRFLQAIANVLAVAMARSQSEEQLRLAEREAVEERGRSVRIQEALLERDEFISVAAHELRTPLTALQLKLQGLESSGGLPHPKGERLGAAVRQTERLARLIDRLLDVSRIAQGRVEMAPEIFDLAVLVRQVAEDFREPAAQARAALELQLPEKVEGSWDRLRIEQVLVSLLANAVKYGAGKPITVKLEEVGDVVRLCVADRGIGIAPDDVDRIFGRFQRAASIRNYGGMGLGLYITRHIVEAHRGTISVASKLGEGSTFVVELPRLSAPAAAGRDKVPRARA